MILVICDRCGGTLKYIGDGGMTAGFYSVRASDWPHNEHESEICDACMWKDPRYIAIWGEHK